MADRHPNVVPADHRGQYLWSSSAVAYRRVYEHRRSVGKFTHPSCHRRKGGWSMLNQASHGHRAQEFGSTESNSRGWALPETHGSSHNDASST